MTPCAMAIGQVRAAIVAVREHYGPDDRSTFASAYLVRLLDGVLYADGRSLPPAAALLRVGVTGLEPGARGWEVRR
jgi:hypothetical protein